MWTCSVTAAASEKTILPSPIYLHLSASHSFLTLIHLQTDKPDWNLCVHIGVSPACTRQSSGKGYYQKKAQSPGNKTLVHSQSVCVWEMWRTKLASRRVITAGNLLANQQCNTRPHTPVGRDGPIWLHFPTRWHLIFHSLYWQQAARQTAVLLLKQKHQLVHGFFFPP